MTECDINKLQVSGLDYWRFTEGLYWLDVALQACHQTLQYPTYRQVNGTRTGFLYYAPSGKWFGSKTLCQETTKMISFAGLGSAATPAQIPVKTWLEAKSPDRSSTIVNMNMRVTCECFVPSYRLCTNGKA